MTQILSPPSSEQSEGAGYWQASDGKWYPPAGGAQPLPNPSKRSLPRWAKITAVAVAAFVLFAVGVGAGATDHTKLDAAKNQATTLQSKLTTTQSQLADVRGQLTTVQGNQTAATLASLHRPVNNDASTPFSPMTCTTAAAPPDATRYISKCAPSASAAEPAPGGHRTTSPMTEP